MRERGFTLIEIAVVLAIVGLIIGGLLGAFGALRTNQSIATSTRNHDAIAAALREFLVQFNRLPCPAVATEGPGDANYGQEAPNPGTCTGTVGLTNGVLETYFAGVVPWVTLGLQGDQRFDGSSRQYAYAVLDVATGANSFTDGTPWVAVELRMLAQDGSVAFPPNSLVTPGGEVVVIVSHGPNGSGAFNPDGGQLPMPAATALNELENLDGDLDVAVSAYSDDDVTPYDDIVRGYTEAQLIEPLVDSGALVPRDVITRQRLENIANAMLAFAIGDNAVDPDGAPALPVAGCTCPPGPSAAVAGFCATLPAPLPGFCSACAPITGCVRTVRRSLPLVGGATVNVSVALPALPVAETQDGWGTPIRYTPVGNTDSNVADGTEGLWSGVAGLAFTLQSAGPNGLFEGCGPPPVLDDICITRIIDDLVGRIATSGNRVD